MFKLRYLNLPFVCVFSNVKLPLLLTELASSSSMKSSNALSNLCFNCNVSVIQEDYSKISDDGLIKQVSY